MVFLYFPIVVLNHHVTGDPWSPVVKRIMDFGITSPECEYGPATVDRALLSYLIALCLTHNEDDSIVIVLTIFMCVGINICKAF